MTQYDYAIEHPNANADALSHVPMEEDTYFDRDEDVTDASTVCTIYGKLTTEFYTTGQGI